MNFRKSLMVFMLLISMIFVFAACEPVTTVSTTGVQKATANIQVQASGLTVEQENIKRRLELENMPGAIKHLYVVSTMTGDVLLYSTIKGKITSSGKRLSPYQGHNPSSTYGNYGFPIKGLQGYHTFEVLQDDGTYGNSIPYIYWFSSRGHYHQHYITGGQMVHESDVVLDFPKIIVNIEALESQLSEAEN